MNIRHLIDSATFETTYGDQTVPLDQRASIDEFIKSNLLQVIDEVFDRTEISPEYRGVILRLENLEIDLGEIPYQDYRQQMPEKLREQLSHALGNLARSASRQPQSDTALIDEKNADATQLFYFLRNGYLPWYARPMDADALEKLLVETIESSPGTLAEFINDNGRDGRVVERIKRQFSKAAVRGVMQLLPPQVADNDQAESIEATHGQFVSGLLSGDAARISASWPVLFDANANLLEKTIRYHGQQQAMRRNIVAGLSSGQFDDLLRLLEPTAHRLLKTIIDHADIFASQDDDLTSGRTALKAQVQEFTLAHILVERANRFAQKPFIVSLIRQLAASRNQGPARFLRITQSGQSSKLPPDLARLVGEVVEQLDSEPEATTSITALQARAYRQLDRIRAALTTVNPNQQHADLPLDIRALAQDYPWLMMRLYRELQTGRYRWRATIENLSAEALSELGLVFLELGNRTDATDPARPLAELKSAIRSNVKKSKSRQSFYAQIIVCLIDGELIDFDKILAEERISDPVSGEIDDPNEPPASVDLASEDMADAELVQSLSAMDTAAQNQMLQCAELLTTASYATGISLSVTQLEALKWSFIRDYSTGTGYLFNEQHFALQYVATLSRLSDAGDQGRFRVLIGQELKQISLPPTRAMTQRLVEVFADAPADVPDPDVADTAIDAGEESEVLEDIHIANAGVVLVAPYLPRLFERMGLIDDGKFIDRDAAERGVHCLQYLVDESVSNPEYQLVLNKLLCGIRPGLPICRGVELVEDEKEQLEALLRAVTRHWKALGNTSVDGLRESFLQRNGRLQLVGDAWHLLIEGKSFDMLLDGLPWAFSTIKFAWMDRVIYVEWR